MAALKFLRKNISNIIWGTAALSICFNVFLFIGGEQQSQDEYESVEINFSDNTTEPQTTKVVDPFSKISSRWKQSDNVLEFTFDQDDRLMEAFEAANISHENAKKIIDSIDNVISISSVRKNSVIELEAIAGKYDEFITPVNIRILLDSYKIESSYNTDSNSYETRKHKMPLEWKVKLVTGKISDNLMSSARAAGIEYSVITKLVSLYSHTIDFQRDIRDGDEFKIMYEYQTNYRDSVMKNPRVLYSYLKVRGSKRELYRDSNSEMYYDQAGKSIKKVLLKTPISGARISSRFGPRKHPVLGYSRMHKGLDYAAPKGTPIYAAGDGVIQFVKSSSSGYGKHIKVRHNSTYSTLYGHMSRFASNVKSGTRVKQGQIIGYVGATGLASGPHLHYEVHKDGKQINPTNVDSSIIVPLSGNKLVAFKKDVNKIDTMLAKLGKSEKSSVAMKSDAIGG